MYVIFPRCRFVVPFKLWLLPGIKWAAALANNANKWVSVSRL